LAEDLPRLHHHLLQVLVLTIQSHLLRVVYLPSRDTVANNPVSEVLSLDTEELLSLDMEALLNLVLVDLNQVMVSHNLSMDTVSHT
jgi:predicted small integral membrane protein